MGWAHIHGEDDVIDGQGLAIGEYEVVTQDEIVIDGAVVVLGDRHVSGPVIGVVGPVVLSGLALDALLNRHAQAVQGDQADLSHRHGILVVGSLGEEGGELAVEGAVADNQRVSGLLLGLCRSGLLRLLGLCRSGFFLLLGLGIGRLGVVRGLGAAGGQHADDHHKAKQQRDEFLAVHLNSSYEFYHG